MVLPFCRGYNQCIINPTHKTESKLREGRREIEKKKKERNYIRRGSDLTFSKSDKDREREFLKCWSCMAFRAELGGFIFINDYFDRKRSACVRACIHLNKGAKEEKKRKTKRARARERVRREREERETSREVIHSINACDFKEFVWKVLSKQVIKIQKRCLIGLNGQQVVQNFSH